MKQSREVKMVQPHFEPFSRRQGVQVDPPITIWDAAPEDFRHAVLVVAKDKCGFKPSDLRDIVCGVLRTRPDRQSWSEFPNIWNDVTWDVEKCEWYRVYDIVEAIRASLENKKRFSGDGALKVAVFDEEINVLMREFGIGWQLKDGMIQARGDDTFEDVINQAKESLEASGKATAYSELREALKDISRRPVPDATGAIQHSMAALECVAKDVTGQPKATLGQILKTNATIVPPPLDEAIHKIWGFASDNARHVREGQKLNREEAHLVVGLAASLANYLVQKAKP